MTRHYLRSLISDARQQRQISSAALLKNTSLRNEAPLCALFLTSAVCFMLGGKEREDWGMVQRGERPYWERTREKYEDRRDNRGEKCLGSSQWKLCNGPQQEQIPSCGILWVYTYVNKAYNYMLVEFWECEILCIYSVKVMTVLVIGLSVFCVHGLLPSKLENKKFVYYNSY